MPSVGTGIYAKPVPGDVRNERQGWGGRDPLARVYHDHVDAVFAFFAYTLPQATAEDLTSATFERIVRFWERYDPARASERTWILAIARNVLTDHFRRQRHRDAVSTDRHPSLLDGLVTSDEGLERPLEAAELRTLLKCLKPRERDIVALRYAGDLPAAEIGAIMGLTSANVHQILSRSLRRLRETLEAPQGQRSTRRSTSRSR